MNRSLRLVPIAALFGVATLGAIAGCERETQPPPQQPQPQYGQNYPGYPPQPQPGYPQQYPTATQPQPTYPQPQPTYTQPQPQPTVPQPQPTTTQPQPQPTTTSSSPFPFPIPTFPQPTPSGTAPSGPAATLIDPTLASAATIPLQAFAQSEAPGMTREGNIVAAQFQEGQVLEQNIQLLPNKCYTVLAVGAGIQEVDISLLLLAPIPGQPPVLARDQGTGNQASLGGKAVGCYKWQLPVGVNAKWVVKATKGAGVAAAALYTK